MTGPKALPAEVFRAVLEAAGMVVSLDDPSFPTVFRESAALFGWVQMDENDSKSWVRMP